MLPTSERQSVYSSFYKIIILIIILTVLLAKLNWPLSLLGIVAIFVTIYFLKEKEKKERQSIEQYITSLSHRLEKVGDEALLEMPIGIMLINENYTIEWANPYLASAFKEKTLVSKSLYDIAESLIPKLKQSKDNFKITILDCQYDVFYKKDEQLLYFINITEQEKVEHRYEQERPVIAIIFLDNYDDLTQGMDDQTRSGLNSFVTSILNNWANETGIYLKRTASDRFIALFNEEIFATLEENKFNLLDKVRKLVAKQNVPLTLSIGVGTGASTLPDLGKLAQSSLDLALGRGGDQVVIKHAKGKVKFYGGKTSPIEKRTRVRARVTSHALQQLIKESSQVIIMGHRQPDMDAIGSAIGIRKMAALNEREGFIVIDWDNVDKSTYRLMEEIKKHPELDDHFIKAEEATNIINDNTLLVIVDTHKPSLVIEQKLINLTEKIVVIDHHRRSEDFIEDALLVYMEPYASSTSELVTELLEYQPKQKKLSSLEATLLLAGIIVDTKSFTLRTGSRTFDAASYLRSHGADTIFVQKLLKEDLSTYVDRAKIIKSVYFYKEGIAIAKGHPDQTYNQVFIAQAADTMLTIDKITASFVISCRDDGKIGISARSLGTINVQLIMERIGGGGHLTNAATQLDNVSLDEAEEILKTAIDDYFRRE